MKLLTSLALFTALASCRATRDPRTETLLDADRRFAADTQARRLDGWLAAFHEHGSQVDESFRPITGRDAIAAHMQPFFADASLQLSWTPEEARVSEHGDLGSVTGRYRLVQRGADGSESVLETGRYFDVWRRVQGGEWKLLYDVGDPDAR